MRRMSKTYILLACGSWCIVAGASRAQAQMTTADASQSSCAAVLADSTVGAHIGQTDSAGRVRDTSERARADTAGFRVGGARTGPADVLLLVGVHADEVRFGSQPRVRVRLCWGGDTVRVVQRDNLPSPVVPGTTYRNVYIAVELLGRINAECLAERIGVGGAPQNARPPTPTAPGVAGAPTSVGSCAFLGGTAAGGTQITMPPPP
jgi:hypothetical protein